MADSLSAQRGPGSARDRLRGIAVASGSTTPAVLFAHCDHPEGRARTIAPGSEGPADAVEKQ